MASGARTVRPGRWTGRRSCASAPWPRRGRWRPWPSPAPGPGARSETSSSKQPGPMPCAAEIHYLGSPPRNYEWVFEADIKACFDEIDHNALMGRVRERIADKRVLHLVKAFLRAGILSEDGLSRDTITGTPQGGILSPLLANIALSVVDEHFARKWRRSARRGRAESTVSPASRPCASSAMRTTSWSWSPAPTTMPTRSGVRWRRCSLRWACACRKRRRGLPHRRGVRLPGVAHPAPRLARSDRQAGRLHLPVEEVPGFGDGQGAVAQPAATGIERSPTCCVS